MDPAAADFYEEDGKDLDFYDFERLPTLPEDEVSPHPNVGPPPPSLAEGSAESFQAGCLPHPLPVGQVVAAGGSRSWSHRPPPALNFPLKETGPWHEHGTVVGGLSLKLALSRGWLLIVGLGRGSGAELFSSSQRPLEVSGRYRQLSPIRPDH